MPMLLVSHLQKRYAKLEAVRDLSFDLSSGEVFGLLGPNGAGKTTTIRIIMDIIQADGGSVEVLGGVPRQAKHRVGYLPEERGLYLNMGVLDVLVYLAELKGWQRPAARKRAKMLLEKVGLADWAKSKVRELSRGMQQKLQVLAAMVNDPDLLIMDEPFQGLDPVNLEAVKTLLIEQRQAGKGLMLSSHQMNLVEALCDRILLMNQGEALLYGSLAEIKRQYAGHTVRLSTEGALPADLPGVVRRESVDDGWILSLAETTSTQDLLSDLVARRIPVLSFQVAAKPLAEIFIQVVEGGRHA